MILQSSLNEQLNNIIYTVIKRSDLNIENINNTDMLKKIYHKYLYLKQNRSIDFSKNIRVIIENEITMKLKEQFDGLGESDLDDLNQKNVIIPIEDHLLKEKKIKIENAIEKLREISEDHYALLNILITDIFIMPSNIASGGSSSECIGLVWANPKISHPTIDIVEFLIHEMTHNCMFIDEHNHLHYNYEKILLKENWAMSAILKKPRPIDKVLHSIIVSTEILLLRDKIIGHPNKPKVHPPTKLLKEQTIISINSLENIFLKNENINNLITSRAIDLLNNSKSILINI
ncbi:HEXXH motif-containing putative peptide modification protein [Acinetobacter sp. NIPH 1852]|uniref:aKG-HExxH-type peptide beta-hydroxylase n=1 Tax=Acinetobacter sp. NIPH 1852 TaxID=2923428 RepID=UPI001F4A4DE2|nr:HEXXH motif-containing putative peptide modification protein [Acinetobacter sp. NIPH 1852]MCH7306645.1 HEXXH motif-containing putative peptide modification protein [Acinetobacter sp. NIPH 1852]